MHWRLKIFSHRIDHNRTFSPIEIFYYYCLLLTHWRETIGPDISTTLVLAFSFTIALITALIHTITTPHTYPLFECENIWAVMTAIATLAAALRKSPLPNVAP